MNPKEIYKIFKCYPIVTTDSRKIKKDALFFALKGDHFDGNKFILEALQKGAKYTFTDAKEFKNTTNDSIIFVHNVLATLQQLANHHRVQLNIPIIAITGSNGKTTTKELINAVLSKKFNVVATKGNLNNHIGVPLTLLSMTQKTEIGIVEMGANHKKEIAFLCNIANPNFGYITNFGKAHLEGFGGIKGVIEGKLELFDYLKKNDRTIFINEDNPIQVEASNEADTILFNQEHFKCNTTDDFVRILFENEEIKSNLLGVYNYQNLRAAIGIGHYFRVSINDIKKAIAEYVPKDNRSQLLKRGNHTLILDAYNANPSSMEESINSYATNSKIKNEKKGIILGDMFELGTYSENEHQKIVDLAMHKGFYEIFLIGAHFFKTTSKAQKFKSFDDFEKSFTPSTNFSYLIKGSRGMALERILKLFPEV